jgi:hypothetical protein
VLAASSVAWCQDARSIVAHALAADDRNDRLARDYTYKVRNEIVERDHSGGAKSTHSTVDEVLYIGGRPYLHPIEKDGKPLPESEQRKEQAKLDRAVRDASHLTPDERNKRKAEDERERNRRREEFKDIPDAFDFKIVGEAVVNNRAAWQIKASPRSAYRGKAHSIMNNLEGTIWIDKTDLSWIRLEADVLNPFRLGWFLARVDAGTHITYRMMRVNDELWVPEDVAVNASARVVLLKKVSIDQHVTFSDYRKFQSDSRILDTDLP